VEEIVLVKNANVVKDLVLLCTMSIRNGFGLFKALPQRCYVKEHTFEAFELEAQCLSQDVPAMEGSTLPGQSHSHKTFLLVSFKQL